MNSLGIYVYNMYLLHSTGIEYYHYGENGQERFLGVRASTTYNPLEQFY